MDFSYQENGKISKTFLKKVFQIHCLQCFHKASVIKLEHGSA